MFPHRTLSAALLAASLAAPLGAQTIRGRVVDAASGEAVPQATVTAVTTEDRGAGRTRTAADGTFELDLRAAGTMRLRGERAGYQASLSQPLDVGIREVVEVTLRMSPQALSIEPLTVTGRVQPPRSRVLELNGFYDRERGGFGRFVHREDIDRHPEHNLVHTLARVPGVVIDVDRRGREIISFSRGRTVGTLRRAQMAQQDICFPLIYLDGSLMRYGPPDDVQLDDVVKPDMIDGIEVYRSAAEIPPQFNGSGAGCGVIVIWTRHDAGQPPAP